MANQIHCLIDNQIHCFLANQIHCLMADSDLIFHETTLQGWAPPCDFAKFPQNCMKLKEFGPQGARAPLAPRLDPPLDNESLRLQQKSYAENLRDKSKFAFTFFSVDEP